MLDSAEKQPLFTCCWTNCQSLDFTTSRIPGTGSSWKTSFVRWRLGSRVFCDRRSSENAGAIPYLASHDRQKSSSRLVSSFGLCDSGSTSPKRRKSGRKADDDRTDSLYCRGGRSYFVINREKRWPFQTACWLCLWKRLLNA